MNIDFFSEHSIESDFIFNQKFLPFLAKRGVENKDKCIEFFQRDLGFINTALKMLFSDQANYFDSLIENLPITFLNLDHVGIEVFGPLSFYKVLIQDYFLYQDWKLIKEKTFPSNQVYNLLKRFDPHLSGVMITKLYFQNSKNLQKRCFELFQASSKEGTPQSVFFTDLRLSSQEDQGCIPINHVAFEVDKKNLKKIFEFFSNNESSFSSCEPHISHNPYDDSYQMKIISQRKLLDPAIRILEFISYRSKANFSVVN